MRFWDSSAIVPTVALEASTGQMRALQADDPEIVVWWATRLECLSPVERRLRDRTLSPAEAAAARSALEAMFAQATEVPATDEVRDSAIRLLAHHQLRAADALQLGAALEWAGQRPVGMEFVSLDSRLREAALREGFTVLP